LFTYACVIDALKARFKQLEAIVIICLNLLIIPYTVLSFTHYQYLKSWAAFKDILYSNTTDNSLIICNEEIAKLIQNFWGNRDWSIYLYFHTKLPVEDKIKDAFQNKHDVYIASIVRPLRDERNYYTVKHRTELIKRYANDQHIIKELPAGTIEIYKIKPE
jgi:hypothetical protein